MVEKERVFRNLRPLLREGGVLFAVDLESNLAANFGQHSLEIVGSFAFFSGRG